MKALRFKETCTQYTVTRERHGDLVLMQLATIQCLYRDISQLNRGINFREEVQIQGIFWFAPTATVAKGDVIGYNGLLYRLEQVTRAKTLLTRDKVQFLKCTASLYRAVS